MIRRRRLIEGAVIRLAVSLTKAGSDMVEVMQIDMLKLMLRVARR
jgi:hypothetical protein